MNPSHFARSVWWLLVLGIILRCQALNEPLLDAFSARQCQTATATEDLLAQRGLALSTSIPWAGDLSARYILEFPLYNYLVIALNQAVGHLDLSGKLTTIVLWAASFLILQFLWRRLLDLTQIFWANLLFVVAPISVFYGQTFMPEMLVQLLAFIFLLLVFRYDEISTLSRWCLLVLIGALGLITKLPEFGHLYLVLAVLVFQGERWKALIRPRYLIAGLSVLVLLRAWGSYVDSINATSLPEWTSGRNLSLFVGTWHDRLLFKRWVMTLLYVLCFILPGLAAFPIVIGLRTLFRKKADSLLGLWLASIAAFYLLWFGNGPGTQSYYNLPALAPFCALFGIGMNTLFSRRKPALHPAFFRTIAILLTVAPCLAVGRYLFQQDEQVLRAAEWLRANTARETGVLFCPNHHWAMIEYPYNATLHHYAQRPTFVWTINTSPDVRQAALEHARVAIVTKPSAQRSSVLQALNRFRNAQRQPSSVEWLTKEAGFQVAEDNPAFIAYLR